jgi:hypothetical protein
MKEVDLKKDRIVFLTDSKEEAKLLTEAFEKFKVFGTNCEILIVRNYK